MNKKFILSLQIRKVYLGKKNNVFFFVCKSIFNIDRQIFCDFGEDFQVLDIDGEESPTQPASNIYRVKTLSSVSSSPIFLNSMLEGRKYYNDRNSVAT